MKGKMSIRLAVLFILAASFLSASLTAILLTSYNNQVHYQIYGSMFHEVVEKEPKARQTVLNVIKSYKSKSKEAGEENLLSELGYENTDLLQLLQRNMIYYTSAGLLFGFALVLTAIWYWHRKEISQIRYLTNYLEKVNKGASGLLLEVSEDEFGKLADEIYKTVTSLYQTREAALQARKKFADNLSNIAHQLKTPITAISLSVQMMMNNPSAQYLTQIQKQLKRLTHLEKALLLLSRIDAGTLVLKQEQVDVFTLLTLAADNLQELFADAGVSIDISEMGEVSIKADLDWTMEAVMNLMKNAMEHSPRGAKVCCSYEKNPLYVQIRIWDEGPGFAEEDLLHIFERFYQGKIRKMGGIGIGLSLAKEIIEMQNGIISAMNLPQGGACFEIRFYSH